MAKKLTKKSASIKKEAKPIKHVAKEDFLWYSAGDEIKSHDGVYIDAWKKANLIE